MKQNLACSMNNLIGISFGSNGIQHLPGLCSSGWIADANGIHQRSMFFLNRRCRHKTEVQKWKASLELTRRCFFFSDGAWKVWKVNAFSFEQVCELKVNVMAFFCIQWILVNMQYNTSYCFSYMVAPPNFHDSVQLVNLQLVDTNFSRAPYQCWVVVSNMLFISYLLGGNDPLWHIFLSNGLVQPPTRKFKSPICNICSYLGHH